jgi:osmoprotectant transport system permease protein
MKERGKGEEGKRGPLWAPRGTGTRTIPPYPWRPGFRLFATLCLLFLFPSFLFPQLTVGSKKFTESYVLGEIAKKTLQDAGFKVEHKQGIGATGIVWAALTKGDIGAYPEYTGTISEEILKKPGLDAAGMVDELGKQGIGMSKDLGFNDGYGIAMRRKEAERLGIETISDLATHPDLKAGISHEYPRRQVRLDDQTGWRRTRPRLRRPLGGEDRPYRLLHHRRGDQAVRPDRIKGR